MPGKRLEPRSDEDRQRIGREVNARRLAADLTLASVAAATGKSIGYLLHIEKGRKRLTPEMAETLAAVYGVSPQELTGESVAA